MPEEINRREELQRFENMPEMKWQEVKGFEGIVGEPFRAGNEVHVWQASARRESHSIGAYYRILSDEEKSKAMNYKFPEARELYAESRINLRLLLAAYTGLDASTLKFEKTKYGKPFLSGQPQGEEIYFNMTHDERNVLYVVSSKRDAGIDLEKVKDHLDWQDLARRYFTAQEISFVEALPHDDQVHAFYYLWTRKEALLKAIGIGLSGIEMMKHTRLLYHLHQQFHLASFRFSPMRYCSLAISPTASKINFYHLPS
ncbi:4'-phosphopantetheinyl transferase family protein [Cohnella endophytica]|uniref:4'-phosphopantetheinyl transferase family protein n=1 Tax=Cohnella endophytica TaxID=2419778 RepID=UPI001314D04C|nr:4'-phosphopantetheinyl transferase superfamily protein [Cohnella endophytica]